MKEEYKNLEQIDNYLSGKLSRKEKKTFEELLSNDTGLRKELEQIRLLKNIIKVKGREELKNRLNNIHDKILNKKISEPSRKSSLNELLDSIFYKYFNVYESLSVARSSKKESIYDLAIKAYNEENYSKAVKLFKKILKDSQKNPSVLFYCGISLLELGKHNEAKNKFMKIIKLSDNPFIEKAEWYLGLSYLKGYNVDKAIKVFEGIDKDNSDYRTARNILKKLKDI
jgi:TolA-binding protein